MERHPFSELFKSHPVFDPAEVTGLRQSTDDYVQTMTAFTEVSAEEWYRYIHTDKSDTVEVSPV